MNAKASYLQKMEQFQKLVHLQESGRGKKDYSSAINRVFTSVNTPKKAAKSK